MSKKNFPTPNAPRELPAIQQDYNNSAAEAGDLQFKIHSLQTKLNDVNKKITAIVAEGDLRASLNKQVMAETAKQEEVGNEPV